MEVTEPVSDRGSALWNTVSQCMIITYTVVLYNTTAVAMSNLSLTAEQPKWRMPGEIVHTSRQTPAGYHSVVILLNLIFPAVGGRGRRSWCPKWQHDV